MKRDTNPERIPARAKAGRKEPARTRAKSRSWGRSPEAEAQASRLSALESLLGDDSPTVWKGVQDEFHAFRKVGLPTLKRAAHSASPRVRSRARTILRERDKQRAIRRLMRYAVRKDLDLERALFLLARYHTPNLDPRPYQRALSAMAHEVVRRGMSKGSELERAHVLVEYLGGELAFGGAVGEFQHPDNIHMHRAIERRAGIPLTMCAVYLFVARRAGLKAAILPLPGHVMLRLYGDEKTLIVDPYHKGQPRTQAQCKKYLEQNGLGFHQGWMRPATDEVLLKRQLTNLMRSAKERGLRREARQLKQVIRILEPRAEKRSPLP